MTRVLLTLVLLSIGSLFGPAVGRAHAWELFRSESSAVARGNEQLAKGQHQEALESYDEAARELPGDPGVQLDRGLALMGLGKLGEAREAFRRAGAGSAPKEVRGPALYDLGLAFMQEADQAGKAEDLDGARKLLEEAVDAFRGSLRAQPNNRDAAWNLELAKRRLVDTKKQQEEKKQQEDEKKKQEQKDQEQKDQEQKDQEQQGDGEPNDGSQGDAGTPPKQPPEGSDAGSEQQPPEPTEADAGAPSSQPEQPPSEPAPSEPQAGDPQKLPEHMERALDALEAGEENLEKQRAKQRARTRPQRIEKDW